MTSPAVRRSVVFAAIVAASGGALFGCADTLGKGREVIKSSTKAKQGETATSRKMHLSVVGPWC